jgi:hypothetical protein
MTDLRLPLSLLAFEVAVARLILRL